MRMGVKLYQRSPSLLEISGSLGLPDGRHSLANAATITITMLNHHHCPSILQMIIKDEEN